MFGKKMNEQLIDLDVETTLVKITGFVGKPSSSRKRGAHQYFFVNGRYMRHPYFHRAIMESFDSLIPEGEQVSYFIYFEVDPSRIDVNIHPTKTEIKFENEQAIFQIILAVVREALGKFSAVPTIDFDTEGCPDIPVFTGDSANNAQPQVQFNPSFNPFERASAPTPNRAPSSWDALYSKISSPSPTPEPYLPQPIEEEIEPVQTSFYASDSQMDVTEKSSQHYQFKGKYILTSVKSGLMMIDQHRAHVRILFDQYMKQLENQRGVAQGLLFPETLQLPISQIPILEMIWEIGRAHV